MIDVRRAVLALGLFLTPLVGWAAFNEPQPGSVTQSNLGTNVFTYLGNAADSATGFISGNALGTGEQAALAGPLNSPTGLQSGLMVSTSAAAAVQNAVNNASGLLQLNPSGQIPTTAQVGDTSGTAACPGCVGEVISSDIPVGSAVSMVTATPKTITSVSLTPGDWDCRGSISLAPAGSTTTSIISAAINTTTNVLPATEFRFGIPLAISAGLGFQSSVPTIVENVASTTPVYLVGQVSFAVSTMGMYGQISCRRMR